MCNIGAFPSSHDQSLLVKHRRSVYELKPSKKYFLSCAIIREVSQVFDYTIIHYPALEMALCIHFDASSTNAHTITQTHKTGLIKTN